MIDKKNIFRLLLASLLLFDISSAEEQGDKIPEETTKPSFYIGGSYYVQPNTDYPMIEEKTDRNTAPRDGNRHIERMEEGWGEPEMETGRRTGASEMANAMESPKFAVHGIVLDLIYDTKKDIKLQLQGTYSFRENGKIFDNSSAFINAYYGMDFEDKFFYYIGLGAGFPKLSRLKEIGMKVYLGALIGGLSDYLIPYFNIEGGNIFNYNEDGNITDNCKMDEDDVLKARNFMKKLQLGAKIGIITPLNF